MHLWNRPAARWVSVVFMGILDSRSCKVLDWFRRWKNANNLVDNNLAIQLKDAGAHILR